MSGAGGSAGGSPTNTEQATPDSIRRRVHACSRFCDLRLSAREVALLDSMLAEGEACRDALSAARAERDEWERLARGAHGRELEMQHHAEAAEASVAALRLYATHMPGCAHLDGYGSMCSCGLAEAIAKSLAVRVGGGTNNPDSISTPDEFTATNVPRFEVQPGGTNNPGAEA